MTLFHSSLCVVFCHYILFGARSWIKRTRGIHPILVLLVDLGLKYGQMGKMISNPILFSEISCTGTSPSFRSRISQGSQENVTKN
jgi:hypothetical protein